MITSHARIDIKAVLLHRQSLRFLSGGSNAANHMPSTPIMTDPYLDCSSVETGRLENIVRSSPILSTVLQRWSSISLPDCWLSGSVIAQTAWNYTLNLPCHHGLADIDLVYFDADDLSAETEMYQSARVRDLLSDVPIWIDAKNEARVHLWYESKFGCPIAPYTSAAHAIATFPTTAGAVGIRPAASGLSIFAPFGLSDLLGLIVRPNKTQITQAIYERKTARWRPLWPQLLITDWSETDSGK
jgi:uncharacterized protein